MLRQLGLGLLLLLALALLAFNVLAFSGALVDEQRAMPAEAAPAEPASAPGPDLAQRANRLREEQIDLRSSPSGNAGPARTTLVLTAARGECWVEARADSATGRPLYAGTLTTGSSLRFNRPRLWLRLGAPENVDLVVNGRPSAIPSGTAELTIPA